MLKRKFKSILKHITRITVDRKPVNHHSESHSSEFDVFFTPEALQINKARLEHLDSLNLPLTGLRVLEVGCGIGLHTEFFENKKCNIVSTDGNPRNIAENARRYPYRKLAVVDLDKVDSLTYLGQFDIVYCYGVLYHLSFPERAIKLLSDICNGMILLETCVSLGEHNEIHYVREPKANNMAVSSIGCRPTRAWVLSTLKKYFGYAYTTVAQPNHSDFETDWRLPKFQLLHRAIFIGSKNIINNDNLVDHLLDIHPCSTYSKLYANTTEKCICKNTEIWIDVGSHLGETTYEAAQKKPHLRVYAFEPNLKLSSRQFAQLENFIVLPMAVGESNGFDWFNINSHDAASSLRKFVEGGLSQWKGGNVLNIESTTLVPTIRLDTFMTYMDIQCVDFLKIDAQGGDFSVILSAGSRIKDIKKITLEVAITKEQLYEGASTKDTVIEYMISQGFILQERISQSYNQEENLTFVNTLFKD